MDTVYAEVKDATGEVVFSESQKGNNAKNNMAVHFVPPYKLTVYADQDKSEVLYTQSGDGTETVASGGSGGGGKSR